MVSSIEVIENERKLIYSNTYRLQPYPSTIFDLTDFEDLRI